MGPGVMSSASDVLVENFHLRIFRSLSVHALRVSREM